MKSLKENELTNITGGSSDLFWTRYGIGVAAGTKCALHYGPILQGFTTAVFGTRAAYAAIRG